MSLPDIPAKSKSATQPKRKTHNAMNHVHKKNRPLTCIKDKIQNIVQKNGKLDKNVDDLTCAICAELFIKSTTLNCSHTFCKYCIDKWRKNQRDCPICRTRITEQVPTLVLDNIVENFIENCSKDNQDRRKQVVDERNKESNNKNGNILKTNSYTWNSLIEALNCAEENNWQDDDELINGDWLNRDTDENSSDEDYDVYAEYDYDMYY